MTLIKKTYLRMLNKHAKYFQFMVHKRSHQPSIFLSMVSEMVIILNKFMLIRDFITNIDNFEYNF